MDSKIHFRILDFHISETSSNETFLIALNTTSGYFSFEMFKEYNSEIYQLNGLFYKIKNLLFEAKYEKNEREYQLSFFCLNELYCRIKIMPDTFKRITYGQYLKEII